VELDDETQAVYGAMLADGSLGVDGLARRLGLDESAVRRALDALADNALVELHAGDAEPPTAIPPRVGLAKMLARAEADIAAQQSRVASLRATMERIAAEQDSRQSRESLIHLEGLPQIAARLEELSSSAVFECVSLNPGRAHRPDAMAASAPRNQLAMEHGVTIRCIYQDSFRNDAATLAYARWLTELGGRARTLPTVPMLLIVVDRAVALLPRVVGDPDSGALEVRTPALVSALLDYFETLWSIADPFGDVRHKEMTPTSGTTRELLHLLARGATDEAIARKLGLSTRTVRRLMSELMASLGATSRFQAGVEAANRGWVR
jgi:DNA-binding CsgD family transcriptional regulator